MYTQSFNWGHTHIHTHHLGDTEAVFEVVEGDVVVSAVHFEQEMLQDLRLDVESGYEVQVCVHHLKKHHDLCVLPLPVDTRVVTADLEFDHPTLSRILHGYLPKRKITSRGVFLQLICYQHL